jgi:DNA transposition AAA+ family ATPase
MLEKIRKAIDDSGLKQNHIARKLCIDEALLSRMLHGYRPMPDAIVAGIACVLGVSVDALK